MKICFVSSMHAATDKRVHYKEAISLVRAGFEVHHVCPGDGGEYMRDGVHVHTYRGHPTILGRLRQLATMFRLASQVDADVYHCNEVDSWAAGVLLKFRKGTPLFFDVHEIYATDLAETRFPPLLRPAVTGLVRLGYKLLLLPFTDRLVLAKESVRADFPHTKVAQVVVANYVEIDDEEQARIPAGPRPGPFTLIHVGSIGRDRGWPQLLDSVARVEYEVRLKIVGSFVDGSQPDFEAQAKRLGVQDRIEISGWIPYRQVHAETRKAHAGLILFQPVLFNYTHALPHKLFDYMRAEIPVIVPDFAEEVARIVRDADCGLAVDPSDPAAIRAAIERLASDPDLCRRFGQNGRAAVLSRYNWGAEAKKLIEIYRALSTGEDGTRGGQQAPRVQSGAADRPQETA